MEVEICIPVYNCEKYIGACLQSILDQTHTEFRLVVSDNCSTDSTLEVIRSFDDPRIEVHRQQKNLGGHGNFNFLIGNSSAAYVKLFCADDVMLPWAIERQLEGLLRFPGTVACGSDMIITDENLTPLLEGKFFRGIACGKTLTEYCVKTLSNKAGGPSNMLFDGRILRQHRLDPSYKYISDLIIVLEICQHGFYLNEGYPSYFYRRHPGSDTNQSCPPAVQGNEWGRFVLSKGSKSVRPVMEALSISTDPSIRASLTGLLKQFPRMERLRQLVYRQAINRLGLGWVGLR